MIKAVLFDLDGVIVSTDECHFKAWKKIADQEGILFDRTINNRLRGVSRMESLDIILEKANRAYIAPEKHILAERKNDFYKEYIQGLRAKDLLPGVMELLTVLRQKGVKVAIGSSSKNSPGILTYISLANFFDATADGNDISRSKPDPEVFLLAAQRVGIAPQDCLVVEDAHAGVEAGKAAGMKVLAVGDAAGNPLASLSAPGLDHITWDTIAKL